MPATLLADSGATKAEWCLINNGKRRTLFTQGISPYFLSTAEIISLLQKELSPQLKKADIGLVHYYGTGCANPENAKSIKKALKSVFPDANIHVNTDLMAAARAPAPYRSLKTGLLLLGAGLGLLAAYIIDMSIRRSDFDHHPPLYFALIAIGGGIGLIASYSIEKKHLLDRRED